MEVKMFRYSATKRILTHLDQEPVVSNLGPTSDELWHASDRDRNFYTYGSMGLCSSIALGMALSCEEKVISLDGDGSILMNLGTIATIGREAPSNLIVVVWDNEEWAQTGHQKSHTAFGTDLEMVAKSNGLEKSFTVSDEEELDSVLMQALSGEGPWFIVAKIQDEPYLPVAPVQPEHTLHRFRQTFVTEPDRVG